MDNSIQYTFCNKVLAVLIAVTILLFGVFDLDNNCNWGDDFAAYMSDGIALARGKYAEQLHINAVLRYGNVGTDAEHIHVWGLPLLHALIYRCFGFDTENFSNLYLYKLPSLLFFSVMAGVFYLFLRMRFSAALSLLLSFMLCADYEFFYAIRNLYTDVLYLALNVLSFFLLERFLSVASKRRRVLRALFLGIVLWYTYSVRLNGTAVLLAVLIAHISVLITDKRRADSIDVLPYILFLLLFIVFNRLLFPVPTSTSSFSGFGALAEGLRYYVWQMYFWLYSMADRMLTYPLSCFLSLLFPDINFIALYIYLDNALVGLFVLLFLIGLLTDGRGKNLYLSLYILLSFFITAVLCLGQGLRYLYVVLPFFLMYMGYGWKRLCGLCKAKAAFRIEGMVLAALLCLCLSVPVLKKDISYRRFGRHELLTAYSEPAKEVYRYIQDNTEADKTISFFKPRALYLNTGRISMLPGRNVASCEQTDYYLYYKPDPDFLIDKAALEQYTLEFENEVFQLYRKIS